MSELITETRGLDIGLALDAAFQVIGRRWPAMLFVMLAIGWVPQVVLLLAYYPLISHLTNGPAALIAPIGFDLTMLFVAMSLRVSITAVALAPQASIPSALASGLGAIPALAPLWLISSAPDFVRAAMLKFAHASLIQQAQVAAVISWPMTIVIACTVGVASAVAVAERRGFFATIARAFRLMSGGRWTFLGAFLVLQVLAGLSTFAITLAFGLLQTATVGDIRMYGVVRTAFTDLGSDFVQAVWAVVAAMCYRQFRRRLDGAGPDEAADIFS